MKKRIRILFISLPFLLIGVWVGVFFFLRPKVTLKKEILALYEEKETKDIISIQNGKLLKSEKIATEKLGKTKIEILVQNRWKRKQRYVFTITVVDTEKPTITYTKELTTEVGTKIDLLKDVEVRDNSKEDIAITIEGEYNFNKVGEYTIYYVAKDTSGNETKEEAKLFVTEKKNVVPPSISSEGNDKTFTTSKGFKGVTKNGVTYIDGILVANKTYSLPSNYGSGLTDATINAFNKMKEAAQKEGLHIYISSGFRSFNKQNTLYNNYVARDGKKEADTYSARPGHSEHQTGLAFDVNTISSAFDNTKEAKWLHQNCYKYGFILRYPKGKTKETGYIYESWHYRYVGEELASKLYNNGDWIPLETYFGITSAYSQ